MQVNTILPILGFTMLILYCVIQILNFYGIGQDVYGIYLTFFIFLIISAFVLPTKNPSI